MNEKINNDVIVKSAWVKRSPRRSKVLEALSDGSFMTPTSISQAIDLKPPHVTLALKSLEEEEIITCLNKGVRKGKIYQISDLGLDCIEAMKLLK